MFSVRRPRDTRLHALLERQRTSPLSYSELGRSLDSSLPAGYHPIRESVVIGVGSAAFERGVLGLRTWRAQLAAGASITPPDAPLEIGTDVLVVMRTLGMYVTAACRIVVVIDEPSRFGFAYGTLSGHPETGEEAFVVERSDTDEVVFRVSAFSRPRAPLARLGAPVARLVQRRVTAAYLRGIEQFVAAGHT